MTTVQFPKKRVDVPAPGIIGIVCGEAARWSQFTLSMIYVNRTQHPETITLMDPGIDITRQCNTLARATLRSEVAEWLWIIGDDHLFNPDIIHRLYAHQVDIAVPNVLQRSSPFYPVVYDGLVENKEDGKAHHHMDFKLPQKGLREVFAAGSAGMLIKREVLEKVGESPFNRSDEFQNEDLAFCALARDAGFKIWCDPEVLMAHVGTMIVWPRWDEKSGSWQIQLDIGANGAKGAASMEVFRFPDSAALAAG